MPARSHSLPVITFAGAATAHRLVEVDEQLDVEGAGDVAVVVAGGEQVAGGGDSVGR